LTESSFYLPSFTTFVAVASVASLALYREAEITPRADGLANTSLMQHDSRFSCATIRPQFVLED
jgi:hypothetical protein